MMSVSEIERKLALLQHDCQALASLDEIEKGERRAVQAIVSQIANIRHELTAALTDQVVVPEIIDNHNTNPLIVISPDQVRTWLRAIADAAGYSDRGSCAIQVKVAHELGDTICLGSPELVLMVSNIEGSRAAPSPASPAGEG